MAENEIPEPPDWSDARTFFLEPDLWHEPYELDASESHHLTRVLRIREGEDVRVLDGRGREGRFRVLPYKKNAKAVALRLLDEWTYPEPESKVILAAGWTKAARRGWILEKAVEFEASGIDHGDCGRVHGIDRRQALPQGHDAARGPAHREGHGEAGPS